VLKSARTVSEISPARFFGLAFTLSWLIWIPLALAYFDIGPLHIPESTSAVVRLLGVLMPAVAAIVLASRYGGGQALRGLLSRLGFWRVGWRWWLAAVLVQPLLLLLTGLIWNLVSPSAGLTPALPISVSMFVVNVIFLLIATLGEEIGWRGVALPALQQRYSPLRSSVILGLLWAIWHIPFWLLLDTFARYGWVYVGMNFLLVLPFTVYITWFFNHTRGSLLLPVMSHLTFNIMNTMVYAVTLELGAFSILIGFVWIVAFLIFRHLEP
jgi:membrane protease YdiL (CAAX protease family)